ncbi:MAG: peptidoglycan-binding domain-containing protein [Herbinix sp.]|nr:peptidoglycan-binding domain-containing protein [Herbinix sp.]
MDTDGDGYKDNVDHWDNPSIYIDFSKHKLKPYNMIMNKDTCFIDTHFNKYPFCTVNSKGEYVVQTEKWLLTLGLINKADGKFKTNDVWAVAYLQKKYNLGVTGIIDNKTYWLISALVDVKKYNDASALNKLIQSNYQNPDAGAEYADEIIDVAKRAKKAAKLFEGVSNAVNLPDVLFTTEKLQHEFKHARDFGIIGN